MSTHCNALMFAKTKMSSSEGDTTQHVSYKYTATSRVLGIAYITSI